MELRKFDASKPHGVVTGHAEAMYEQDGVLYDGVGEPLIPKEEPPKEEQQESKQESKEAVFLKNLLDGTQMAQKTIKQESDELGLIWDDVRTAAADMGMNIFKQGSANIWKLPVS